MYLRKLKLVYIDRSIWFVSTVIKLATKEFTYYTRKWKQMPEVIELPIPTALTTAVDAIMRDRGYVPAESLEGKTIKMKEFSKKYCGSKSDKWIRLFIFDEFPETNVKNGGWVVNPRKTAEGSRTFIFEKPAQEWLNKHRNEIDWNAKLP